MVYILYIFIYADDLLPTRAAWSLGSIRGPYFHMFYGPCKSRQMDERIFYFDAYVIF